MQQKSHPVHALTSLPVIVAINTVFCLFVLIEKNRALIRHLELSVETNKQKLKVLCISGTLSSFTSHLQVTIHSTNFSQPQDV
jgi:cell division protein ZapA (FtsZ GTPase activity inhibitor)